MNNLENNIKKAVSKINSENQKNNFSSIYPFTTENIKGYLDLLDLNNKDILTVGASGDHLLNLLLKYPKSIDYFDINPFTKYYVDLKISASKVLTLDEFLRYFWTYGIDVHDKFNIELFNKFSNNLLPDSKIFWESLYKKYDGITIRNSRLFSNDQYKYDVLSKVNDYLDEKNYIELSKIDKQNHTFYESDIKDLETLLDKPYDVIMLSNIIQYMYNFDYFKEILYKLDNCLTKDGIILVCYLYDINSMYNEKTMPFIYNLEKLKQEINNIDILSFNSITDLKYHNQKPSKDAVVVYKKTM